MSIAESELISWPEGAGLKPPPPSAHWGSRGVNVGPLERVVSAAAGLGLIALGGPRRRPVKLARVVVGGALLRRGLAGKSRLYTMLGLNTAVRGPAGVALLQQRVTILGDRTSLYRFWRDFRNAPRFMSHVESVEVLDGGRSRWRMRGPTGKPIEWVASMTEEREGDYLAWSTLPGASHPHEGVVRFADAPGGRGTEVEFTMRYRVPGGQLGVVLARLSGLDPKLWVSESLRHFKRLMESGEIATATPQPSGHRSRLGRRLSPNR